MGRKSKKGETITPWCYYCEQEFTNDNDLILHQKARHFKCSECGKKMATIVALKVHLLDVRTPAGLQAGAHTLARPPLTSHAHLPPTTTAGAQGGAEKGAQCQGWQGGH